MALCCSHSRTAVGAVTERDLIQLMSVPKCDVCRTDDRNLWLCMYDGCYMLGCSDEAGRPDHSTKHFRANPSHIIQVNIETRRAWCYECNREVSVPLVERLREGEAAEDATLPFGRPLHPNVEADEFVAKSIIDAEEGPTGAREATGGLVGLANLGNTCYMNAALQCLSNIPALTEFFITCPSFVTKADAFNGIVRDKPSLAKAYLHHLREVWTASGGKASSARYVSPSKLLLSFKSAHPMFRGYHQQDSQEFLRCFMDQLHEELMEPVEADDDDDSDDEKESEGDEADDGEKRSLADDARDDEEELDYETADSGVSEDSASASVSRSASGCGGRKRKIEDAWMDADSAAGDVRKRTSSHCTGDDSTTGIGSDGEAEFADAASTRSASPPNPRLVAPRSPAKSPVARIRRRAKTYRSVISDVFDGKLVSSVQCLTCDRVSSTTEVFQDLSLPIPSYDAVSSLRQPSSATSSVASTSSLSSTSSSNSSWLWWMWGLLTGWFYGPNITLHDCLAYFFSADELKGDNMYSCEKCKKLRNGLKYSRVTVLPDALCIHLKRFRHEFAFSSKISTKVTFPLVGLDMSPWLHKDCVSRESLYDLVGVICHQGTAGGGHYTSYALNFDNQEWYEFDDTIVTRVDPATVLSAQAYVLFYRKNNIRMDPVREEVQSRLQLTPSLVQFYVSRQWLNKLETFAEPGPIDNSDFLCRHGSVRPSKAGHVYELCVSFPPDAWNYLHATFGGGPACTRLHECVHCREEMEAARRQKQFELDEFKQLHADFQKAEPAQVNCLSSSWFKQWELFVTGRHREPPGPIDNRAIVTVRQPDRQPTLRTAADYVQVSHEIWSLLHSCHGGGPEVILKSNGTSQVVMPTRAPQSSRWRSNSSRL